MGKAFHTAHRWQVEWQDDTDVLTLGHGRAHGPFDYPEGCVVFASFRGPSSQHRYEGSPAGDI
jgi:hypothetical protein